MKEKTLIRLLIAACVLTVVIMVLILVLGGRTEKLPFTPPPFDSAARAGVPTVDEHLGWSEINAEQFTFSVCGEVILQGDTADVWLTNPQSNTVWLKLRVLDAEGNILGETGIIRPGEYVQSVTFTSLPKDGADIALKIMAYQPETYYSEGTATLRTVVTRAQG